MSEPNPIGRPKLGGSAWAYWIEWAEEKGHKRIAALGRKAERAGYGMRPFAKRCGKEGKNLRVLQRYFEATRPQEKTVVLLSEALGADDLTLRCLLEEMYGGRRLSAGDVSMLEAQVQIAFPSLADAAIRLGLAQSSSDSFGSVGVPAETWRKALCTFSIETFLSGSFAAKRAFADELAEAGFTIYRECMKPKAAFPEHVVELLYEIREMIPAMSDEQEFLLGKRLEWSPYVRAALEPSEPSTLGKSPSE